MKKLEKNVLEFKKKSANIVENFKQEMFDSENYNRIQDNNISSPIEQILLIAIRVIQEANFIENTDPIQLHGEWFTFGLNILPQFKIRQYRVDFFIELGSYDYKTQKQKCKNVVIECDSQKFHDRTEAERRYEKKRDRDIQKLGYKVFRFTGSEIIKNPFKIAAEILEYLTDTTKDDLLSSIANYK
ncbi:MAG: DUF559 domain-containing protein [Elusimicrobiales bacterium]|nr:DUF559 domain-containing protein [Elusimicrobiales bacterium]